MTYNDFVTCGRKKKFHAPPRLCCDTANGKRIGHRSSDSPGKQTAASNVLDKGVNDLQVDRRLAGRIDVSTLNFQGLNIGPASFLMLVVSYAFRNDTISSLKTVNTETRRRQMIQPSSRSIYKALLGVAGGRIAHPNRSTSSVALLMDKPEF